MPADPSAVESAFHAALADRAILAGLPAEVRREVEKLLAAHDALAAGEATASTPPPTAAHDPAATGPFAGSATPATTAAAGTVVAGRYKLLQQIGEGGMGTVWMADQTEPVTRRVAVKLIRADRGNSQAILSRFAAERQAIALMDHPHIAKLLDAGTTGTGEPFFVMELVKGVPLTDYCDQHRLSVPDRLGLFVQICSAVQHAHQKGIIHRDLKPSNVLVESHDGKPVPKVIDFGLAKATTGLRLTADTLFTGFGTVLGTPLYMAPEQAAFNAVDVDTRADVYALGVILYELLTGTTPITREAVKSAALDEMLRLVREQDAPTPSSWLSGAGGMPNVAANRQTEPAKLGRFVKGELDWIALKALAKERDRRYETAAGFARDIERFLHHEPVQAGPVGAGYRLSKFVRRNRGPVTAAGVVFAALAAGVGVSAWQWRRAEGALARVTEEQGNTKRALDETTAEQARTAAALKDVEAARGQTLSALRKLTDEFVGEQAGKQVALTDRDRQFFRDVLAMWEQVAAGRGEAPEAKGLRAEGARRVGLILFKLGEWADAEQAYRDALVTFQNLATAHPAVPDYQHGLALTHTRLGVLLETTGRPGDAERAYRDAMAIRRQLAAAHPAAPAYQSQSELATTHMNLGILLAVTGRPGEAERAIRAALTVRQALDAAHPTVPAYQN